MLATLQTYFKRFQKEPRQIHDKPHADLGMVWIIPCYNEPALLTTLDSLFHNHKPQCAVEIIVVLNAAASAPESHRQQNQQTWEQLQSWIHQHNTPTWRVHPLYFPEIPDKIAGVGTARKIGMDEAVDRFLQVERPQGLLVCLDADCLVDTNYMTSIEQHFLAHPDSTGAAVYFEHPLEQSPTAIHREAIAQYELHLRYYVQALRYAGLPYACHTVGSTMVVQADTYCKVGGMNRRKAGEDFYFLQKVAQTGRLTEINTTRVLPSSRLSHRVPFGTGKAMSQLLDQPHPAWQTYHPMSFVQLQRLCQEAPLRFHNTSHEDKSWLLSQPETLQLFLHSQDFVQTLQEIRDNTSTPANFHKRLFQKFDLFVAMKWLHFSRDHGLPNVPVCEAATWLLKNTTTHTHAFQLSRPSNLSPHPSETESLLQDYRFLECQVLFQKNSLTKEPA